MTTIVTNITSLISAVAAKGRAYTDSRNSLVAHALLLEIPQKTIVEESGLDKGDVSRIAKIVKSLDAKDVTKLKKLNVSSMDADSVESLSAAVALGSLFRRQKPAAGSKPASKSQTGEDESKDMRATIYDYLTGEGDFAAKLALINDVIETVEAELAAAAA